MTGRGIPGGGQGGGESAGRHTHTLPGSDACGVGRQVCQNNKSPRSERKGEVKESGTTKKNWIYQNWMENPLVNVEKVTK